MSGADAGFAFLLGVVAAFNPCGFALLPAYLAVIVTGSAAGSVGRLDAIRRAIGFGLAMTLGFVVVFTGFGLLFGAVNAALQGAVLPLVPYLTVTLGVVLVALGVSMLVRGECGDPVCGSQVARHGQRSPRRPCMGQPSRWHRCPARSGPSSPS